MTTSAPTVFKSASVGVLLPPNSRGRGDIRTEEDSLQVAINRSSNKPPSRSSSDTGLKGRRVLTSAGRVRLSGNGLSVSTVKDIQTYKPEEMAFPDTTNSFPAQTPKTAKTPKSTRQIARQLSKGRIVATDIRPRYVFDLCPEVELSPTLRSPPRNRRGSTRLVFDEDLKGIVGERIPSEQEKFVDLVRRLQSLVSQAAVRLSDLIAFIRSKIVRDANWKQSSSNYEQFSEISFEIMTANYYLAKWHHQLEPGTVKAPPRPEKLEDMPVDDIMAQVQSSIARMEILTAKLAPILNKIVVDAKTMTKGADGRPLSANSKDPVKLAAKRGCKDVADIHRLVEHLEHLLGATHHLAHPPTSGLENCKKSLQHATAIMMAANRFKKSIEHSEEQVEDTGGTITSISSAYKTISNVVSSSV